MALYQVYCCSSQIFLHTVLMSVSCSVVWKCTFQNEECRVVAPRCTVLDHSALNKLQKPVCSQAFDWMLHSFVALVDILSEENLKSLRAKHDVWQSMPDSGHQTHDSVSCLSGVLAGQGMKWLPWYLYNYHLPVLCSNPGLLKEIFSHSVWIKSCFFSLSSPWHRHWGWHAN